ncbi:MAG: hypothetical protein ISS92_02715 [Candidatus Omnitrophica bacterium]|nr:hypothetical protein [Candidatus Omnitrophota bacterium]
MKKLISGLVFLAVFFFTVTAFAELTEAQKTEQRRQQEAAKRAYQASARQHNEVADQAEVYKEGAEFIRDTAKKGAKAATR